MQAMILAAGLGSRLGSVTEKLPKCLVEVHGKPLLQHVIERLVSVGVSQCVVNTWYLADQVAAFVQSHSFGCEIKISNEPELLGTGGGILFARKFLESSNDFLIHNADVISTIDLKKLFKTHCDQKNTATLAVMSRETKRPLLFDTSGNLAGWKTDSSMAGNLSGESLAFCGVQAVSSRIFHYLEKLSPPSSSITAYLAAAQAGEAVKSFRVDSAQWFDVGTPERLREVEKQLAK